MIPTSTHVRISVATSVAPSIEALVVFIAEGSRICGDAPQLLDDHVMRAIDRLFKSRVTRGKSREVVFDLLEEAKGKTRRLFLVGVGQSDKLNAETIRQAAGAAAKAVRKHRIKSVAMVPPVLTDPFHSGVESAVCGWMLASFDYEEYRGTASKKSGDDAPPKETELLIVATKASLKSLKDGVERGLIIAEGQNLVRTIAHRPANDINPITLADVVKDVAKEVGLTYRVLDEKQMKKLGMGGILAVGAGAIKTPPRMIVLEHTGKGKGKPLLLVGKAITFDTGGISIKPAEKMGKMIFDKCGAMAVLGAMYAIAKMDLPVRVVGILSSAENHISEMAYRPGDILHMYNGVTVEVTNTDAEGRLVLGDALAWGIETYKPKAVVDLATLTGGVIVALGRTMAGVMSNSDALVKEITTAGEHSGERMWRLPLGPDQRDQIKSEDADIVNSAGRDGHPLQGGAFLSYFIPEDNSVPWVHLDIAGVADTDKELPYYKKGATGWGVRTLVAWAASQGKD